MRRRALAPASAGDENLAMSDGEPRPELRAGVGPAAWDGLLAFLARGRGDAGIAYEELRRRLEFFFEWKGCVAASELADETLNRVAAKLAAGEDIRTEEPARYAFGVARFVYLEAVRHGARRAEAVRHDGASPADDVAQRDARLAALEACLEGLPPRTQQMLLRYHADDGRQRIDHRKQLADELGIEMNALRIRVHRVRSQIANCVRSRLARDDRAGAAAARRSPP
jgi:DNA-directed RNA polymerase specialized sigma24 family protein